MQKRTNRALAISLGLHDGVAAGPVVIEGHKGGVGGPDHGGNGVGKHFAHGTDATNE